LQAYGEVDEEIADEVLVALDLVADQGHIALQEGAGIGVRAAAEVVADEPSLQLDEIGSEYIYGLSVAFEQLTVMFGGTRVQVRQPSGAKRLLALEVVVKTGSGDFTGLEDFIDADVAVALPGEKRTGNFNDVGAEVGFAHDCLI